MVKLSLLSELRTIRLFRELIFWTLINVTEFYLLPLIFNWSNKCFLLPICKNFSSLRWLQTYCIRVNFADFFSDLLLPNTASLMHRLIAFLTNFCFQFCKNLNFSLICFAELLFRLTAYQLLLRCCFQFATTYFGSLRWILLQAYCFTG